MKTCPDCAATDLPDKAKVCGHCGTRLAEAPASAREQLDEPSPPVTVSVSPDSPPRSWYWEARVWAAGLLLVVVGPLNLGWAMLWIEGERYQRGAGSFSVGDLLGVDLPALLPGSLFEYPLFLGVLALAVVAAGAWGRPATARRIAFAAGGLVLLLAAGHVIRVLTDSIESVRTYVPDARLTLGSNPGPWVTAILALGFFVPSQYFRGQR